MPTITKIAPQVRRRERYSIYIDDTYCLSLSEGQLVDARLRVGDKLTASEVEQLAARSDLGKALDRIYHYLSYRPRSRYEIVTYLQRHRCDDDMVVQIVTELERRQLIDDGRFAAEWVAERQQLSPRSRYQLRSELRQKRIATEHIEAALEAVDATAEAAAAAQLITAKRLAQRYGNRRRLTSYLTSIGFSVGTVRAALDHLNLDLD